MCDVRAQGFYLAAGDQSPFAANNGHLTNVSRF
jgi:hypothetical protein